MKVPLLDLTGQYKLIHKEIDSAIKQVLESGHFILGENVFEFEREFANYCGTRYAVAVANGTDALELSLRALGILPGDSVITTPFTFIATAESIVSVGARPVFVDIDLKTFNIDPNKLEELLIRNSHDPLSRVPLTHNSKLKALIPVHLYGQPCDMDAIMRLAKRYNLKVIEDCAQAAGAGIFRTHNSSTHNSLLKKAGSFGDCGCFSFFPSKNLGAYGDGGIVVTNNKNTADRIRSLRFHGREDKYHHRFLGRNSRLDELQAAILRIKLRHLDEYNDARRRNARFYSTLLSGLSKDVVSPHSNGASFNHIYHIYAIRTKQRDGLRDFLKSHNIETGLHYPVPIHLEEAYRFLGYKKGDFPNAELAAKEVLSLPMYPELKKDEIEYVVEKIKTFFNTDDHR